MRYTVVNADCLEWLCDQPANSIHAVVTDPPFSLVEYTPIELKKKREGHGGVWRIPPSFGNSQRAPLPRFTELDPEEMRKLSDFFTAWARAVRRVLVPGAHVLVAANTLLSHAVFSAIVAGGLEKRGEIVRLVRTIRGGDRPKGAEDEFAELNTMPRSCWEPWGLFRKPLDGTVVENLRKWQAGALRRLARDRPLPDVIESERTPASERAIADHPTLKPQSLMRVLVRCILPLGEGTILDPFMGGGSTIAAAEALGYRSVGIEIDRHYFEMARQAIPRLSKLQATMGIRMHDPGQPTLNYD